MAGCVSVAVFDERLAVPWWWWPVAAALVALLGAELWAGLGWIGAVLSYAALGTLVAAWLIRLSRVHVTVGDGELRVGRAHLPVHFIGEVLPIDRDTLRRLLRRDVNAFAVVRGYLPGAVYVELTDPRDPTPYWLVSTRDPQRLVAALRNGPR